MAFDIPNKIIFKRKEVIGLTKLDGRVLDYWESEFGGINPVVNGSGDKSYTKKDVETVLRIKQLLIIERIDKKKIKDIISGAHEDDPKAAPVKKAASPKKKSEKIKPAIDLSRIKSELKDILEILEKRENR